MEDSEENDPNVILPHMLFDQESHDLICPVCEHAVTGEVILQKRKRALDPVESGERPHGIQANLQEESTLPSSSKGGVLDSLVDTSDNEEAEIRNALYDQTNYELLCPDCESCITHNVILQKRKRATRRSDTLPRRTPPHLHAGSSGGGGAGKRDHSEERDPPLKRHRRSHTAIAEADLEGREIRSVLQNQRIYDLSCPDCTSRITYQVILKPKANASGKPVGLLEKRRRRRRTFATSYVDDNPWRTRYKLAHGHSKPIAAAKAEKLHNMKDALSRARDKYGDIENGSLAEPLLPVQQQSGDEAIPTTTSLGRYWHILSRRFEEIFGPCAITYFLLLIFLYCVWWLLKVI